ncbi:MAG: hypothetical protein J6V11_02715 [Alphaproteobacteria bacterium]|nr:hypothetical protein [Alphaproteobacteria bacterium]
MKKMLNYIANGKGIGLKYFMLFSVLICILCWFLFSSVIMKNAQMNEHLNQFFSKVPTLEIVDGRLIEPKNTYLSIPIVEGYNDELIINTVPEMPVNLNFASGIYLSSEAVYFKVPAIANDIQVIQWSKVGNRVIDRAALDKGLEGIINIFSTLLALIFCCIVWGGYVLVQITTKLFFWVWGYHTGKGQTGRATTISWIGVLSVNFVLLLASLQLSIPIVFVIAIALAVFLVVMSKKSEDKKIEKGHNFFDTIPASETDVEPVVQTPVKPVKVASKKKKLKLVEKPRREPSKKNMKK